MIRQGALALLLATALAGVGRAQWNGCPYGLCATAPAVVAPTSGYMLTPILSRGGATTIFPSNSATNYTSIVPSAVGASYTTTLANKQVPIPIAGTFKGLYVSMPNAVSAGTSYTISLNVNGTLKSLSCQITSAATICNDSTNNVSVAAGDLVAIEIDPAGTPASQTGAVTSISMVFQSAGTDSFICGGTVPTNPSTSVTQWTPLGVAYTWTGTSDANVSAIMPAAGTLDRFYAFSGTAVTTGSYQVTVDQNGVDSVLTASLTTAGNTASDLTHSISVAALDTISVKQVPTSTPPTRMLSFCARWTPTVANQFPVISVASGVPSSGTTYGNMQGSFGNLGTETTAQNLVPALGGKTITLSNFVAAIDTAPTSTNTKTLAVGYESFGSAFSSCGPSATITSTSTVNIGGSAKPGFQDTTNSCAVSTDGRALDVRHSVSGTQPTLTWLKYSAIGVMQ